MEYSLIVTQKESVAQAVWQLSFFWEPDSCRDVLAFSPPSFRKERSDEDLLKEAFSTSLSEGATTLMLYQVYLFNFFLSLLTKLSENGACHGCVLSTYKQSLAGGGIP